MSRRRILALWLPRLTAERALRAPGLAHLGLGDHGDGSGGAGFAVIAEDAGALRLVSVCVAAEARGLRPGMALTDARAMQPALTTRMLDPGAEARFRGGLLRWSRRFSPWTAPETACAPGEGALALDITGCAHLFGGEAAMAARMLDDLGGLGLTARAGVADTRGAAWALARCATTPRDPVALAAPGLLRAALEGLPIGALRARPDTVAALSRLGLRRIGELAALPRAALARRFGADLVLRLDQALGMTFEPISPAAPPEVFAVRLTLPEPIGLRTDLAAALARLLARLAEKLEAAGRGARRLRLEVRRVDGDAQSREVGLARPGRDPARLAPLFDRALDEIEAGFGIDAVRLEAVTTEPLILRPHRGPLEAAPGAPAEGEEAALADLIGRLGARIGLDRILRPHPADSHIPGKTARLHAAAYSPAPSPWPAPASPRPVLLFGPEPAAPLGPGRPPPAFRWRRGEHRVASSAGPERIAPEWWLDDPAWRDGPRDYWRVETEAGQRLWLYEARSGPEASGGWFVHGRFA